MTTFSLFFPLLFFRLYLTHSPKRRLLLEDAKDLVLQLVGKAGGDVVPLLLGLVLRDVLVAGAAATDVVVRVVLARPHRRLGHQLLIQPRAALLVCIADVGRA